MIGIDRDVHDHFLRRLIQDQINKCGDDPQLLRGACELLAESYVNARVAAKWAILESKRALGQIIDEGGEK